MPDESCEPCWLYQIPISSSNLLVSRFAGFQPGVCAVFVFSHASYSRASRFVSNVFLYLFPFAPSGLISAIHPASVFRIVISRLAFFFHAPGPARIFRGMFLEHF